MKKRFLILILVGCMIGSTAVGEKQRWPASMIADLMSSMDTKLDFFQWCKKSGPHGVFHSNIDVKELLGTGYAVEHLSSGHTRRSSYGMLPEYRRHVFTFSGGQSSGEKETTEYGCLIVEADDVVTAHRELCMQWMRRAGDRRGKTLPERRIGNKHFVDNADNPNVIYFTRGNILVILGRINDSDDSVLPVAEHIDRRLGMKHLIDRAEVELRGGGLEVVRKAMQSGRRNGDEDETEELKRQPKKRKPGEPIVLTEKATEKSRGLSVVTSFGTVSRNDKGQLILDTGDLVLGNLRVWKVSRQRCAITDQGGSEDGKEGATSPKKQDQPPPKWHSRIPFFRGQKDPDPIIEDSVDFPSLE